MVRNVLATTKSLPEETANTGFHHHLSQNRVNEYNTFLKESLTQYRFSIAIDHLTDNLEVDVNI
jgi:hypothetical protein